MAVKQNVKDADHLAHALYKMLVIRRFEEQAGDCYRKGLIGGFCHLYIGQEAVVCGTYDAIKKTDYVITSYRDHAHIILSGAHPKHVMAELFGKVDGVSRGKGGSMHLFNVEGGFYGGHGIVGAQVPIGTGVAFASKYKNDNAISVVFFGDGASNQGQVFESFNMAKLWNLPALYIIENNRYAMGTSVDRCAGNVDLYKRGESFGIQGERVDGMDYFAVKSKIAAAAKHVRSGKGPKLIEVDTYRYRGHSMSDPAKYRTREEVDEYRKNKDPILLLKVKLIEDGIMTDAEFKMMEQRVKAEIQESIEFANNSPFPGESELWTDVFPPNN